MIKDFIRSDVAGSLGEGEGELIAIDSDTSSVVVYRWAWGLEAMIRRAFDDCLSSPPPSDAYDGLSSRQI